MNYLLYNNQKVGHVVYCIAQYVVFKKKNESLIPIKTLLLFRPGTGHLVHKSQYLAKCTSAWFLPLGCCIPQSRVLAITKNTESD